MNESRLRRRGVRASRLKLTRALAEAGLKTQAALAERIADLEGLEAAPKDIVSRVFREQPVDPSTLERVARALQTDAYKLYLSADEPTPPGDTPLQPEAATEPSTPSLQHPRGWTRWIAVAAVAAVLVAGLWWVWPRPSVDGGQSLVLSAGLQPRFGRFKVAVTGFQVGSVDQHDQPGAALAGYADDLTVALGARLEETVGVPSAALPVIAGEDDRGALAHRFRVDAIIDGEVVQVGQLIGVRLYAYVDQRGRREQVWSQTLPASAGDRRRDALVEEMAAAVNQVFGIGPAGEGGLPHFALAPVHDEYLRARWFMDQAPSEINVRRAAGSFGSALRHDSNYAAAHAGLCEVMLNAVWLDEQRQLADAERSCIRAMQLAPQANEVLRAHAAFLDRSGRAQEAAGILAQLREREPDDVEVALALANAEFDHYRRSGESAWGQRALNSARAATDLTPSFWKPFMWLGIYESGVGTLDGAIAALETAHRLDADNEYVVTNLGTMYFCRGDFLQARDLYLQAQQQAPGSYAGTEFLGLVHYYLGDFTESARLRQQAVDMALAGGSAEIHQIWGALGDSYRQSGRSRQAIEAYRRASEIVERDFLMGNGTTADKASRAYYYLILAQLDSQRPSGAALASLERDLQDAYENSSEALALMRVTQSRLLLSRQDQARQALQKATERCPCYEQYPDFAVLAAK